MAQFVAIPNVDTEGLPEGQTLALAALKENVELLAGIRGGRTLGARAIRKEEITVQGLNPQLKTNIGAAQMTVQGQGYTINEVDVPTMSDFVRLINDVVETKRDMLALVEELTEVRQALSALIEQLRR